MTFTPIRTRHRDLRDYYRSRPDLAKPERSPVKTSLWGVLALIGLVLTVVVYLDPAGVIEATTGPSNRRAGATVIGLLAGPPVLLVVGLIGIWRWSPRWRLVGGDRLRNGIRTSFSPAAVDPAQLYELSQVGGQDNIALGTLIWRAHRDQGDAYAYASDFAIEDRLTISAVFRKESRKHFWIDQEPVIARGDAYFEAHRLLQERLTANSGLGQAPAQ